MARNWHALLAVAVVGGALAGAPPAYAAPDPWGVLCGMSSDPEGPNHQVGTIDGGPVVLDDTERGQIGTAELLCELRVNGVVVAEARAFGTGVLHIPGAPMSYHAALTDYVEICTTVRYGDGTRLHYDDTDGRWSGDAGAPCPEVAGYGAQAGGGGGGSESSSGDNDRSHSGGRKSKGKSRNTDPVEVQAYYPTGRIEISSTGAGPLNFGFTDFDPPIATWTCTFSGPSVTCNPPPPPLGYTTNICGVLTASALSVVAGDVTASTSCLAPPQASATSTGPTATPTDSGASPNIEFPWTCAAVPGAVTIWTVVCTVAP